jgi:GH24 family phage-related lysozyme (muramidase)
MKKLLILFVALFSIVGIMPGNAASQRTAPAKEQKTKRSIMELPLFERAVLIIKKFETLHNSRIHWPYLGYGHRKLPGEKYFRGYKMSEREADALLRKDLRKFCALYRDLGKDSILLGALAYNIGPGAVNKSRVYKMLKSGNRNIFKAYTSQCHYKGKWHRGLYTRRCTEIATLFMP